MMTDDKTGSGWSARTGRAGTAHASGDEPGFKKGEWLPPRMRKDVDISIPSVNPE